MLVFNKEPEPDPLSSQLRYEIFGRPIGQTGNCYHFISSLKQIVHYAPIEIWEGQRSLDRKRADEMTQYFYNEYLKTKSLKLRGAILLCKKNHLMFSNVFYLIDGQHRYHALKQLLSNNFISDINIRIDILIVEDEDEIRSEFVNINKSVPVPIHYLTPNDIVNLCYSRLKTDFPKAFGDINCKRPAINGDNFKDAFLDKENLLSKFKIDNADKLYNLIVKLNNYYKNLGTEKLQDIIGRKNKAERKTIANCYDKCLKGEYLFLGIFKGTNWTVDLGIEI